LNEEYLKKWASQNGNSIHIKPPFESSIELKQIVLDDMVREGKKRGLMSFEQVKAIEFIKEPFTIENGLLTPTFKSRRFAVEKKYKDLLMSLYTNIDA
jgi:long-chain acyl-CoA synthetase